MAEQVFAEGDARAALALNDPGRVSKLQLVINKSKTLRLGRVFGEALVASTEFADVVPLTDQTLYIIGKKVGTTRLTILSRDKTLLGVVELEVSYDVAALKEELNRSIPYSDIMVRTANGRLLLSGTVPSAIDVAKTVNIVEQFTASCAAAKIQELTAAAGPGAPGLATSKGSVVEQEVSAAGKCYSNALTVRASQQVLLEVRFIEAQRTAARDLGFNWNVNSNRFAGATGIGTVPQGAIPLPVTPASALTALALGAGGFPSSSLPFGTFITRVLDGGTSADVIIQALEKRGLARRLAEPNLTTLSGDTAKFLAGGEFPFPVQADNSRITLEFKKFGVGLAFTPTVLADRQINLKIEPEVSDIDTSNSFTLVNGITVPSLVVRRANTTVELRDGQSFAVAGLLQTKHRKNQQQLPWLGDVPVLGALFRSASYEKEESDLVIIVTPRLVRPAVPGQKLATPLDQRVASNDRDFFLRGVQEVPKHYQAPYGHILESGSDWSEKTTTKVLK